MGQVQVVLAVELLSTQQAVVEETVVYSGTHLPLNATEEAKLQSITISSRSVMIVSPGSILHRRFQHLN